MTVSTPKRVCLTEDVVGQDRLSELPDGLIIHILSFLPTLDAVRTVLIPRFGNLWTFVPTLNFSIAGFFNTEDEMKYLEAGLESDDIERFYIFGRNVFMLHKSRSIDKFRLHANSDYCAESIPVWLRCALDRHAKEISYRDISDEYLYTSSVIPNLTSKYLVKLELNNCKIDPQHRVNLGSLKKLLLYHVFMCEGAFKRLISGCPFLEELGIRDPYEIEKLSCSAPNIHKLSLDLDFEYHSCSLEFPNVKSLDLKSDGIQHIIDFSSVRDVYLSCSWDDMDMDEDIYKKLIFFMEKLKGAETFELTADGSVVFLHSLEDLNLAQFKWKRVVLELLDYGENCFLGICELLRGLEHLEELAIHTKLTGAEEVEFVKCVSTFEKASKSAGVVFASMRERHLKWDDWGNTFISPL